VTKHPMTVMHVISNLYDGGAEGALYRLSLHSPQYKHVVVCMMDEGKYGPMLVAAGVGLHCLNMPQGKPTWRGVVHFWKLLRKLQPDVVQTWMYHADLMGGVMARLSGVRKVFWGIRHGNLSPGTVKRSTIWVAKLCARLSTWVPNRIVSCSQQAMETHAAVGYAASRMQVIPNGYELSRFAPDLTARARLRSEWRAADGTFVIGMVARFNAQKDHANLLLSLKQLKQQGKSFHCVLVGTGMDATNEVLMDWLEKFGVSDVVRLLGRRDDVPALMNALDLHVLSSLGEAFPNVLAEAMACGTPCVTTDVGDAAYIVGEHGWVVPPQDSAALASGVAQAQASWLGSPALWRERQLAVRARIVQHFSIEKMAAGYAAIWETKGR
jgi:glycosyltransferase involved in cell wall biosynthesis